MKKYLLNLAALFAACATFTSCLDEDESVSSVTYQTLSVTNGAFVLNEGNYYSGIDGSLSYITYKDSYFSITNNMFYSVNSRSLGGTPNDMVIVNGEAYIAVTDENRVEILAGDLSSKAYLTISQPRELATDGSYVYVTSYAGTVTKISCYSHSIVDTSEEIGACLEGIAYCNGYLYVCNAYNSDYTYNTNVVKLTADGLDKVSDITVEQNPTTIKTDGTNLYVVSMGDYYTVMPQIQKIDSSDNVTVLCDGVFFDIYDGDLYVVNYYTDYSTYETTNEFFIYSSSGDKTTLDVDTDDVPAPCAIAVDPNNGYVFISTYVMGAYGYADYSAAGLVYVYDFGSSTQSKLEAGVGPCTIVFNETTYIYLG